MWRRIRKKWINCWMACVIGSPKKLPSLQVAFLDFKISTNKLFEHMNITNMHSITFSFQCDLSLENWTQLHSHFTCTCCFLFFFQFPNWSMLILFKQREIQIQARITLLLLFTTSWKPFLFYSVFSMCHILCGIKRMQHNFRI